MLCQPDMIEEATWLKLLQEKKIPTILILNKADIRDNVARDAQMIEKKSSESPIIISALTNDGIESIRNAILSRLPEDFDAQSITRNLVGEEDLVLLVMPQDLQAPKGRLILPQVQTIRELLDKKCLVMSCTTDKLSAKIGRAHV